MTKAEAIAELIRIWHSPHLDLILKARLGEAIEALKGADGDLISRQDAIEAVAKAKTTDSFGRYDKQNIGIDWALDALKALPSAEARPTGTWIFNTNTSNGKSWNVCSECGESMFHPANFCPNCGADMRGGGNHD